jgi:hypothetical protein
LNVYWYRYRRVPIVASGVSLFQKNKNTADSNNVCDIDLVSYLVLV